MKRIIPLLLLTSCTIPVTVRNTPERPVPVAGMGVVEVQERDGQGQVVTTAIHKLNPSLGEVPAKEDYEDGGGSFWGSAVSVLTQAGAGNYFGAAATAIAAITGGAAASQARKRKREAIAHKEREAKLAAMDPTTATQVVALDKET